METPEKSGGLFSHADPAVIETPTENTEPAVYTALFSGNGTSGQVA